MENPFAPSVPDRSSSKWTPLPRSRYAPLVRPSPLTDILPPTPAPTIESQKRTSSVLSSKESIVLENDLSPTPISSKQPSIKNEALTPTEILADILNTGWTPPEVTLPVTPQPPATSLEEASQNTKEVKDTNALVNAPALLRQKSIMKDFFGNFSKVIVKRKVDMLGFQTLADDKKDNRKPGSWSGIMGKLKNLGTKRKDGSKIEISRNGEKVALETVSSGINNREK